MIAGGVMVAAQGVADQHRVVARGVQLAVGFVDQLEVLECHTAFERQRRIEALALWHDEANAIGRETG